MQSELFCEKPYSIEAGREGFRQLLRAEVPFTAVICGSDVLAFGVLAECRALKVKVPDKLSITGFDDLEFAAHLTPPLTTIRVPAGEMGSRAAEYVINCVEAGTSIQHIHLEATLILRETTAPPPGSCSMRSAARPNTAPTRARSPCRACRVGAFRPCRSSI